MIQDGLVILLLKVFLVTGEASLVIWMILYTIYQPWWRDPVGRTLVIETLLIAGLFVPSILSLFFHFNHLTSQVAAWIDLGLIAAVTPVMLWRIAVWRRIHHDARKADGVGS